MSDYLATGGIRTPDILANTPRRVEAPRSRDELFLEGYGRQFGEKMTYSIGLMYGLGLLSGGSYGFLIGLQQGGATPKLRVNAWLNSMSRYGPGMGNQAAIITMYYVCFNNLISWARGTDDVGNAASSGAIAGAMYKVAGRSWQAMGKYSAVATVLFTGVQECHNPLFETHWFTETGSSESLAEVPTVVEALRLCPLYNGRASCCRKTFEQEQLLHFNFWQKIYAYKLERSRKNKAAVVQIQQQPFFNSATDDERAQYFRVLGKFDEVLAPENHASCFSALVTYTAGMLCFSCEPQWKQFVHLDYGKIVRILLTDRTCTEIYARCEKFGQVTSAFKHVLLDSRLATMQMTALENFDMFADQQALCDWMHNAVAMHPFTTPSEIQREAAPIPNIIHASRRLWNATELSEAAYLRQLAGANEAEPTGPGYDAMDAGKASGFDITWGGVTSAAQLSARFGLCFQFVVVLAAVELSDCWVALRI